MEQLWRTRCYNGPACNKLFSNSFHVNVAAADLKDSRHAQYVHTWNTLELFRAVMLLQLQLPGTKMTRHAIHKSLVYLWADCRECVFKHCIVFPYVNDLLMDKFSSVWRHEETIAQIQNYLGVSFISCRQTQPVMSREECGGHTTNRWGRLEDACDWCRINYHVMNTRENFSRQAKTSDANVEKQNKNLFIYFLAEFGAQAFVPSALRWFTLPLIVGMFVDRLQHARQKS